jgi:serine O-acetyltransferase
MKIPEYTAVKDFIMLVFDQMTKARELPVSGNETSQQNAQKILHDLLSGVTEDPDLHALSFYRKLDSVRLQLDLDAEFIVASDPAATGLEEVRAIYPGFFAIFCYRIAHLLSGMDIPLIPRMITEYAHRVTGIDIHPKAGIDCPFAIDHGTGIVIGETATIGKHVKMYQGVTLGALSVDKTQAQKKRHPDIEDNVILYAGCTILGGDTKIGKNSIIGGNVWLTSSIAPDSVVYHKGEIIIRRQDNFPDPLNFVI